ncbi:MAG: hypothetical protein VW579_00375 [Verrucomicrobiales bacterium]|jgi:hypothetical protein|nr:hypothetical protein [Verrucomicrobiota bacterium]MEC8718626.1 hypothetical protein [Verrucomicrobiota bacterium]HBF03556.1 hypothetical protein [Verrucomicrobiales bacterium]HCB97225.1 hypothetical protein [Verrucomicrobiales bacterium]|tara:strand:- start:47 stop:1075 length:1029 start_codon:yes stop_codon:yes gene_type:complete
MKQNNQMIIGAAIALCATMVHGADLAGTAPFQFRYDASLSGLPEEVASKVPGAHGGFAVDHQTGEVFFGLKGAGIIWMSNDLKEKKVLPVTEPMILEGNFHNTTILYRGDGKRFLALPDNEKHRVYIISDEGKLSSILHSPMDLNDYYAGGGAFNPTDTEYADGRLYVADGYSAGNYISIADPWSGSWTDEYFGGKATKALEYGLFGTAHGITLEPHTRRLAIADRANSRIQDVDFHGTFLENVNLPKGSLPCDVDFHQGYVLIGCLRGPEGYTSAPCYVVDKDGNMLSEVNPKKDFGLELFTHIHNAAWKPVFNEKGQLEKLYALATAWNPGGFAVMEVVR